MGVVKWKISHENHGNIGAVVCAYWRCHGVWRWRKDGVISDMQYSLFFLSLGYISLSPISHLTHYLCHTWLWYGGTGESCLFLPYFVNSLPICVRYFLLSRNPISQFSLISLEAIL